MKIEEYPRTTIILRNVSYEQAEAIVRAAADFNKRFAVEVTLNTSEALNIIKKLKSLFDEKVYIGSGTVRTLEDVKQSIKVEADFILGPHTFTTEMINLAKENNILTVPAAMTPSEIDNMFSKGADIVKVFPAAVVTPRFFSDVQAPLGKLPLMAVGGVSQKNVSEFFNNGSKYVGIGSGMFPEYVLNTLNHDDLTKILDEYLKHIN